MLVLVAALHLSLTPVAYTPDKPLPSEPLTRNYLALCDRNAKVCSDYLFDLIWRTTVGPQKVGYCLSQTQSQEEIVGIVTAWLRKHPALADKPTDPSINKALVASYPC
jgi:hypothetical protein